MPRTLSLLLALALIWTGPALLAQSYTASSHGNPSSLPAGCRTCHKGHGLQNTAMLEATTDVVCVGCHGEASSRLEKISAGLLSPRFANLANIDLVTHKRYGHGRATEVTLLPEDQASNCASCHSPHYAGSPNPYQGLRGVTLQGETTLQAQYEFEVCFNCHSRAPGAEPGADMRDVRLDFSITTSVSRHPIDRSVPAGTSASVSLIDKGGEYSITCSTCHGNSDPNGPAGIHGSDNSYILRQNVETNDFVPESEESARLCYSCHKRESILNNESFAYHSQHLNGQYSATPCLTCHDGHGSPNSPSLIVFNPRIVTPTSLGILRFLSTGVHAGVCSLTCHNVEHDGWSYGPAQTLIPTLSKPSSGSIKRLRILRGRPGLDRFRTNKTPE